MKQQHHSERRSRETPLEIAFRGVAAGLAATAVLSVLSRLLPGMSNRHTEARPGSKPQPPQDPGDRRQVEEWQMRSWSPAAYQPTQEAAHNKSVMPDVSPAAALVQPVSPGPEGLAEQFAFKTASGLFNHDISSYVRPAR